MASQETFTDRSRDCQSVLPQVWQIELVAQVTWCSSVMRTRLAQKNASMAPWKDIDQRPPASAGPRSENATIAGNKASTLRMCLSASRSGANFCCEVWLGSNSHMTCAQIRPLASALASSPYFQGECGSPSLSL